MPNREWIIERCTQRRIGADLVYEDWPLWGAVSCSDRDLMTEADMMCTDFNDSHVAFLLRKKLG